MPDPMLPRTLVCHAFTGFNLSLLLYFSIFYCISMEPQATRPYASQDPTTESRDVTEPTTFITMQPCSPDSKVKACRSADNLDRSAHNMPKCNVPSALQLYYPPMSHLKLYSTAPKKSDPVPTTMDWSDF